MSRPSFPTRALSNRTRRSLAALALLAVLVRALIPTGFMPVAGDQAMRLVVCDGIHHHMASHEHPGSTPSRDVPCPFAAGAGPALIPVVAILPQVATTIALQRYLPTPSHPAQAPLRHSSARGPPSRIV